MIPDIIEEHFEEADFLFEQRLLAVDSLSANSVELAWIDRRLRAHLDGLVLGAEIGWEFARETIREGSAGEAFAAATLALESGDADRLAEVEAAVPEAGDDARTGIAGAFSLTAFASGMEVLHRLLRTESPEAAAVAVEALSFRRFDPGRTVTVAIQGPPAPHLAASLRAAVRMRIPVEAAYVGRHADSEDPEVALAALEGLLLASPEQGRMRCRQAMESGPPPVAAGAAVLLGLVAGREDLPPLVRQTDAEDAAAARGALLGLGIFGETGNLHTILRGLEREETAGVARVALERMVGEECPTDEPERGPEPEEDEDAEIDWHPDDDLPGLDPDAMRDWWTRNGARFPPGTRFRRGREFEPGPPRPESPLRLQRLEALEHALARPGERLPPLYGMSVLRG